MAAYAGTVAYAATAHVAAAADRARKEDSSFTPLHFHDAAVISARPN
jgi:hypothetical protein